MRRSEDHNPHTEAGRQGRGRAARLAPVALTVAAVAFALGALISAPLVLRAGGGIRAGTWGPLLFGLPVFGVGATVLLGLRMGLRAGAVTLALVALVFLGTCVLVVAEGS